MAEHNDKHSKPVELDQIVARAVAQALQDQIPQLQEQIVQQVLQALPSPLSTRRAKRWGEASNGLVQAVATIHAGTTQKEILRALLDAGSRYCSRIALFVVKAGAASGWQARGFAEDEGVKDYSLDLHAGRWRMLIRTARPRGKHCRDGRAFAQHFGGPSNEQVLVLLWL